MLYVISVVVPSNGMIPRTTTAGLGQRPGATEPTENQLAQQITWIDDPHTGIDSEYTIQSRMEVYEPPRSLRGMSTRIGTKACVNRVFLSEAAAKAACVWLSQQFPGQAFGWFEMKAMVEVVPPEHPNLVEKTFTANGELVIHESQ